MFKKLTLSLDLLHNMGWPYVLFRLWFLVKQKTGVLQRSFPIDPLQTRTFISLASWKKSAPPFFFAAREEVQVPSVHDPSLEENARRILEGKISFFSAADICLGKDYDWVTNPDTGYRYDTTKHWTRINDYAKEAGDIKFVWEKSRFSYLYTLIRYDQHFGKDHSAFVFAEILSWIAANPVNRGPNYKCSQEISVRILNWTFALYYYKHSAALTEAVFETIMHSIYWQVKHVYSNIHFSRIAVRNNHAITETMTLFLAGFLFPFFPQAGKWLQHGKKWFEQEVAYQVYPDGTFLQFSMNYHRVVVQLLTWGIKLSELNGENLANVVYERAAASLQFLASCMNEKTGYLPNYGANDGALFFPMNDAGFRDYRPQLGALAAVLQRSLFKQSFEDSYWYGPNQRKAQEVSQQEGTKAFPVGGYYLLNERGAFTFVRCGAHKDRPSQADNLHLDLWIGNENILRDSGSYKYNAGEDELRYFFGTASHNTVMLGEYDQMLKGGRFIWFYWTQAQEAGWTETESFYEFNGSIRAFRQVGKNIIHKRTVRKYKKEWRWEVVDELEHATYIPVRQLWHPANSLHFSIHFSATDEEGKILSPENKKGWYSSQYGIKEESPILLFSTTGKKIRTIITATPKL